MAIRSNSAVFRTKHLVDESADNRNNYQLRMLRQMASSLGKQLRVAVMGSKGVGKTTIVNSIRQSVNCNTGACIHGDKDSRTHANTKYINMNDCRSKTKKSHLKKGQFTLEVMDTPSVMSHHFKNLFIHNANVFVLVYDVTDMTSFDEVSQLRWQISELKGDDVPVIVLGNKLDKGERMVNPIMADCVVTMDWEAMHFEVSANDSLRMNEIVDSLLVHPSIITLEKRSEAYARSLSVDDAVRVGRHMYRLKHSPRLLTWLRALVHLA